jgi:hypothetical protein
MSPAAQKLADALAVLEALKPYQDTGAHPLEFSKAWAVAMDRAARAAADYTETPE